jgi:uncharacterized membrane protein SirB2
MDFAVIVTLLLFFIHLCAVIAGGANAVMMPIVGPRLATATPEVRSQLFDIVEKVAKVGKYALGTLLVTGLLMLWLAFDWNPPNAVWFWIKMAGIVAMIVFIAMNERNSRKAKQGDREAAKRSQMFGKLTGLAFAVVIFSAIFTFS